MLAAEISVESPDFGHLEPIVDATVSELERAGVAEKPKVAVADAGYWHHEQMDSLAAAGIQVVDRWRSLPSRARRQQRRRLGPACAPARGRQPPAEGRPQIRPMGALAPRTLRGRHGLLNARNDYQGGGGSEHCSSAIPW